MNETVLCEVCKTNEKTRVSGGQYCCDGCNPRTGFNVCAIDKVYLRGWGNESVKRLKEMERGVILPDERKDVDHGYYLGRRGENGKIQDRWPSD